MTRDEHMKWCKERALKYCDIDDTQQAYASMASDLSKHPETDGHIGIMLGMGMLLSGSLSTPDEMRKFINGFNQKDGCIAQWQSNQLITRKSLIRSQVHPQGNVLAGFNML